MPEVQNTMSRQQFKSPTEAHDLLDLSLARPAIAAAWDSPPDVNLQFTAASILLTVCLPTPALQGIRGLRRRH